MDWGKLAFDCFYGICFCIWGWAKTDIYLTHKVNQFFDY
jgi:hypothetical protein